MGVGVVVVAWHSPKRRIAVSEPPFLGDQKVAWFVHLIFFWNENRQKGKIMFNTWLIPKLYLYTKKWYCPRTDMENGRLWWLKIQVSSVTIRHIFRHLSANTTFWKQCFECLHTLHINDVPHKALNAWFFARAREREGCGCFLGTSWKSYRPPFFMGWWPTSFTLLYDVRVCHHTKGTTISIREEDAPSVGKYGKNNALEQPPQDRKHISWKTIVHFLSHRKASLTFLTNNFSYNPLPFI